MSEGDDRLLDDLRDALQFPVPPPTEESVAALRERAEAKSAGPQESPRPRRSRGVYLVAAAALIVIALIAAGVLLAGGIGNDDSEGAVEYAGPLTEVGTDAEVGELTVLRTGIGRVIKLETEELPILPTGEYYEVWFVGPEDTPADPNRVSAGTFHPDTDGRSEVQFAAAVDPALYPEMVITSEPGDGDPQPSGIAVLRAEIPTPGP